MQKKIVIPLLLIILFILLACTISYEGISDTDSEDSFWRTTGTFRDLLSELTVEAPSAGGDAPPPVAEPTAIVQPTIAAAPDPEPVTNTTAEYSVTAQNFDCICQETGMVTQEFKVVGDQLQIGDMIFDKIDNNTYKRSWMGYYILVSGEGDNKTETQVEECRSSIIILTDTGYIMENYQGESGSPCCINTFIKNP